MKVSECRLGDLGIGVVYEVFCVRAPLEDILNYKTKRASSVSTKPSPLGAS